MTGTGNASSVIKFNPSCLPQDCWVSKGGAFTGEVSAEMLHDFGIPWVILGHSGGFDLRHCSVWGAGWSQLHDFGIPWVILGHSGGFDLRHCSVWGAGWSQLHDFGIPWVILGHSGACGLWVCCV